jgi:hypothetical protein
MIIINMTKMRIKMHEFERKHVIIVLILIYLSLN